MNERPRTVILLAGPSGSGKSHLVRASGARHLRLDDFYLSDAEPGLPMRAGRIDWDDVRTWDLAAAATALGRLVGDGRATVPVYSIAENRAVGEHEVVLESGQVLIAEGIFAPDLLAECRRRGIPVTPLWLDRPVGANFARRLRRDLSQHRKPPLELVRRGLWLARRERHMRRAVTGLGFQPASMRSALGLVKECAA